MAEKNKETLANFMKKQANDKLSKQSNVKKSSSSLAFAKNSNKGDEKEVENAEEMSEEEQLEEAKKASRNKAGATDQTEMFKKLILESIVKYVLLITLLVVAAIGLIKLGPVIFEMLHGLLFKVLFSGVK